MSVWIVGDRVVASERGVKRAYVLADNKLGERAGWDFEMLALDVGDLQSLAIDTADLGLTGREIDDLLRGDTADPRENEVPAVRKAPMSRSGDVWVLDHHRLI